MTSIQREFYLRCAALAMHAELNTAGAFKGPAKALAAEAERFGRPVEMQIAHNAYMVATAMLDMAIADGVLDEETVRG